MLVSEAGMFIPGCVVEFKVSFCYGIAAGLGGAALRAGARSFLTFCLGPSA